MSNEVLPFLLGTVVGALTRRRRGGMPLATRDRFGILAACLTGVAVTAVAGELATNPILVGVDAALSAAGFAAVAVVHSRTAAVAARAGLIGGPR